MDRQDRIALPLWASGRLQHGALVDHLLRATLDLRVAALHRVEVQRGGVGPGRHRARRTAAHANTHAGATELHQQAASGKRYLAGLAGIDAAQPAGDHDWLVVAALHGVDIRHQQLFVLAEVSEQVGPAEFVVERRPAQRPFGHDLQRAGNVVRSAIHGAFCRPKRGHGETGQSGLGARAAPGSAFVANLAAGAGGRAGKRRNRCRMVVCLDLHQHMVLRWGLAVLRRAQRARGAIHGCGEPLDCMALHHRRVVGIGHDHVLRMLLVGVADHAEQGVRLRHAVDREAGVEYLVATVLAVGLGKHHQLDIGGVAAQLSKRL